MSPCCVRRAILVTWLFCGVLSAVQAAQTLKGHVPAVVARTKAEGVVPPEKRMDLVVGLPLRNQPALNDLLKAIYDPASPDYRHYLTPAEFTARFGPTKSDYQAVSDFFAARGFTITGTHPNRMLLDISAPAGEVEKVLHTTLRLYQHPSEDRTFFAPETEPSLDLAVPILHISGLDDFVLPHPASLHALPLQKGQTPSPLGGSGPSGAYIGRDFRAAYAPNVSLTGSGQYVGLLQFDGYYASDINMYLGQAGMTNVPLINVILSGATGAAGSNNIEVALDIEMAISMAPGLQGVIVYEGSRGNDILNRMAVDNQAKQLSSSWSFPTDPTTSQIFTQFAMQGQSYFNASGDQGAYTGAIPTPCDHPYVTSVGGTTLSTRGPGLGWLSEATWNWASTGSGDQASSGGVSPIYSLPVWQQGLDMSTNHGSVLRRNLPDVAMVSDNVYVIANNGQPSFVGGDSVAAPLWAGFIALANQQAAFSGQPTVGYLNPTVYALGKGTNYASLFHDIKTGNNTNSSSPTLYYACPGYDLCTGWGTPAGRSLINALAPLRNAPVITATTWALALETCTPTNGLVDPGEIAALNITLQNLGGVNTTNLLVTLLNTNGVSFLSTAQSYGALAAGGGTATRAFTFSAEGVCGAPIQLVFQLQDGTANLGTASLTLPTGKPAIAFSENFDSVSAPPVLPSGWTAAQLGGLNHWGTYAPLHDSAPNCAGVLELATAGFSDLTCPPMAIHSPTAQLTFRNNYDTEADSSSASFAFDGGVLEIQIGTNAFTDILAAGGSFSAGGYNRTIQSSENPLNGRSCWAGTSGGFISSVINLPAAAAGQSVRFRWRFGQNNGNLTTVTGWFVDNVTVTDGYSCCTPSTNADFAVAQSIYPVPAVVNQSAAYSLTVSNLGPAPAASIILSNRLPENTTFVFASPGYTNYGGGVLSWNLGVMTAGRSTNFLLLVTPNSEGSLTNTVTISSGVNDPDLDNNISTLVSPIYAAPTITVAPSNVVALPGSDVTFQVQATGTLPLAYQWKFGGVALEGQTSNTLVLSQVQPAQAGLYTVVITNLAGSITSTPVTLSMFVPPAIDLANTSVSASGMSVAVQTVTGLNYTLEYKDNVADPAWTPIAGPVLGNGSLMILQDTNAPSLPSRFYRINCN